MAITYVGAGAVQTGTNPTVPVPAGYAAGDLLLIFIPGTAANNLPFPTGWQPIATGGANPSFIAYARLFSSMIRLLSID